MLSAIFHVRLRHKVATIGALGIFGVALVGGIYLIGAASQERYRVMAVQARMISDSMARIGTGLLKARRAEKDFLLRADERYITRHSELAKAIAGQLETLQQKTGSADLPDLSKKIDEIRAGFGEYLKHFTAMSDARHKLGLNEDSGLEGALRNSVHDIESELSKFDEPRLVTTMLMMRRHEKDFMLRRNSKYGDDIKKRANEFAAELRGSSLPAGAKDDIAKKLATYQKDFFAWFDTAKIIDAEQHATSDAFATIEPIIEALEQGVEKILRGAEANDDVIRANTKLEIEIAILAVIIAVGALGFFIGRAISHPLSAMTSAMSNLAAGDLDVVVPGIGRKDEIGEMAAAVETFKVNASEKIRMEAEQEGIKARAAAERKAEMAKLADTFEAAVGHIVETVASASTELEAAASTLTRTAENTEHLSGMVASASNEASTNVQTVAAATEELDSSVREIARQVQESNSVARQAVADAEKTDVRIGELSQAASRIGDVVKLITAIAEQTNLLALNATIEAARAGDAGRGFAVVAQEVKALATQTAKATDEIGTQIAQMQIATEESVSAIKQIGSTIGRIFEITGVIAAAIEEQGAVTTEISSNIQQAAKGTSDVAGNIAEVNQGATETGTASAQVLSSAQALASENTRLKMEVEKFLETVRAA
ncbi:MAG TPA: methyl-accepting chemotaxis protein [Xanthobacteraceae bacterium]|jgi:methyl-accepting chemotaxis protein|nr:methyl-accepting chemotaxis protein [Xanthobacteraceae bacterium]